MQKKGFTLLEVLIVVVILASVVLFAAPAYKKMQARAQYNAALGTLIQLGEGLRLLYENYPNRVWGSDPIELNNSNIFSNENVTRAKGVENLNDLDLAVQENIDTFFASLVARGYMARLKNIDDASNQFRFFICHPDGDPGDCCNKPDEIACMYIPQANCNDLNKEYSWAHYFRDGHYERVTNRNDCP